MSISERPTATSLLQKQLAACAVFGLLLVAIVTSLYFQNRQREWILRGEQAKHRLDVAFELISREVDRVRSDALFLADQTTVKGFAAGDQPLLEELRIMFSQFVKRKETYDQIRLIDLHGQETVRVNYATDKATLVGVEQLQDKSKSLLWLLMVVELQQLLQLLLQMELAWLLLMLMTQ